jgi:arylsulfatase A-like enzyme
MLCYPVECSMVRRVTRRFLGSALVTALLFAIGCSRRVPAPPPARTAPAPQAVTMTPAGVRLVVAIVVDQLPSWALERYLLELAPEGALRSGVARGVYFPQSRFGYAGTYTAPGHASLVTGALPRDHGVVANEVWSQTRAKTISVVDDGTHLVLGEESAAASPGVLVLPTVGDTLEAATAGAARTVSLSYKDRTAVLLGGKRPDLALWYDSKRGTFTTSSYYAQALPDWLTRWQAEHPAAKRFAEWSPEAPGRLEALLGPDLAEGKGDWLGLGQSFPHDPRRSTEPNSVFRATPAALEHLLDLARESIARLELGADDVPDLLLLSISNTDYVGHAFGAESWEYVDNLRRSDRALGLFLSELERRVPIRVLITSDHGVAALPERARAAGRHAQRLSVSEVAKTLNRKLSKQPDAPALISAYNEPFLYFSKAARSSADFAALVQAAIREVTQIDGILAAYSVADLTADKVPRDSTSELARASVRAGRGGDVFVVVREHSVIDPRLPGGSGTSHGSPWSYDQLVPVLFFGAGIDPRTDRGEVDVLRVAPTLSALLGVPAPDGTKLPKLPGSP